LITKDDTPLRPWVLITGVTGVIGSALLHYFWSKGFNIFGHFHQDKQKALFLSQTLNETNKNNDQEFFLYEKDLSHPVGLKEFEDTIKHYSFLYAIHGASFFGRDCLSSTSFDYLHQLFLLHVGTALVIGKHMLSHAHVFEGQKPLVICFSDSRVIQPKSQYFSYDVTKNFLVTFTKHLAVELAPAIRFNTISPGFLSVSHEEYPPQQQEKIIKKTLLQSCITTQDILCAVEFLLTNSSISGQVLHVGDFVITH
jgi:3-oxoacyl-[acyl-carrier protein] reductase